MTAVDHDHAARLVTHLSQQRSSGKYCDVCVCVAEQRFLAHKCVLSANSDQLDALILDATDEDNASHDIEIEIHGVSPVGFEIVLEYFYTGVLRLEPSTVTHTWMTAVYLGLPDIISRCNSYCQQSVSLTAQAKATTVPSLLAVPVTQQQDATATTNVPLAQLSTSTILSSASNQPKVNSTVKPKTHAVVQSSNETGKGDKPQPFEIRENRTTVASSKEDANETNSKKAKLLTMDESAIAWNYGQQNNSTAPSQTGVAIPVTSVPQVVVNLVQGYGTYQPVDINAWSASGTPQQWAQVQVGKGQLVAGVIPIAAQVKTEQPQATGSVIALPGNDPSGQNGMENTSNAEENNQKSYATLSLVSQDSQQSESKNADTTSADIATPVPATPAPSEPHHTIQAPLLQAGTTARSQTVLPAPELNLDNIQFTQINTEEGDQQRTSDTPASTAVTFVQPIAMINNLQFAGDGTKCETMLMQTEVEQLRIQHQQLQRLRQLESGENGSDAPLQGESVKAILATSKRKRKAPTRVSKSEDGTSNTHELHAHSNVRKSKSLAESVLVTITPEHMDYLYRKYPEIKKESPVSGTCDVMQLLQHGKARQRKSSEQNALNNTIRTILDTTGIVESGDARVQDAVCFIMDRFTVLQEHMNDAYVRKQLTIKVKHSIHCKKWRLKRHKMKKMMSSTSSPDAQGWMVDANTSNISVTSDSSLMNDETFPNMRKGVVSNNSIIGEENLSEIRKGVSPSNSLLNDESLHG